MTSNTSLSQRYLNIIWGMIISTLGDYYLVAFLSCSRILVNNENYVVSFRICIMWEIRFPSSKCWSILMLKKTHTLTRSGAEVYVIFSENLAHKLVIGIQLVYLLIFVDDAPLSITLVCYIKFVWWIYRGKGHIPTCCCNKYSVNRSVLVTFDLQ